MSDLNIKFQIKKLCIKNIEGGSDYSVNYEETNSCWNHVGIDGVRDPHGRRLKLRDNYRDHCQTGDTPTECRIRDEQLIVGHFERSAIKKKFKNDVSNFITIDYLKML
jgi:hypothetical protein